MTERKHLDKLALRAELVSKLSDMLTTARIAHAAAVEGATHSEARSESDKDTRGLEQSYIARGQATRVAELEVAVAVVSKLDIAAVAEDRPIISGCLVTARGETGAEVRYFVASHGGGVALADGTVQVVTPTSPLGRAICGRLDGDDLELQLPAGGKRALTIVAVH